MNDEPRHVQIFGNQDWTGAARVSGFTETYTGGGAIQTLHIPVGQFYTGTDMRLVLINDQDSGPLGNEGRFRCLRVIDGAPSPAAAGAP